MRAKPLKVGVSAVFDPAVTAHARTFLRALCVARNHIPQLAHTRLIFADDAGDPKVARAVAATFVEADVDLVVGHLSSDAALTARDIYAAAGIPMITPAATADAVIKGSGVFRLCPPDRQLAERLLAHAVEHGWTRLRVQCDGSAHGQAIAKAIGVAAPRHGVTPIVGGDTNAVVFAGRLAASASFVARHIEVDPELPLILTDDAVSPHLPPQPLAKASIHAVGFRPINAYPDATLVCRQYRLLFGSEPETYFLETYAAFQILAALQGGDPAERLVNLLESRSFRTVLAVIKFEHGDACSLSHAIWTLGKTGFEIRAQGNAVDTATRIPTASRAEPFAGTRL